MALQFNLALRNTMVDIIGPTVDAGASAGFLRIYDGVQPPTGGAVTALLAELTMGDPSFAAAVSGTIVGNAITPDSSANASGTATWYRIVDSDSNQVIDGPIADLNLNTNTIVAGVAVAITQYDITINNP